MSIKERQDIQEVNSKAEQLNFLLQTIHAHHKDFDCFHMNALLGMAYDLAGSVYSWTKEEEKIVLANEDEQRRNI